MYNGLLSKSLAKRIHCWLDIERVGGMGLFHSIADGLGEADTMLVFVSDEVRFQFPCMQDKGSRDFFFKYYHAIKCRSSAFLLSQDLH